MNRYRYRTDASVSCDHLSGVALGHRTLIALLLLVGFDCPTQAIPSPRAPFSCDRVAGVVSLATTSTHDSGAAAIRIRVLTSNGKRAKHTDCILAVDDPAGARLALQPVPDGEGGTILFRRNAQACARLDACHVSASGDASPWQPVAAATPDSFCIDHVLVASDGAGGAFVAWETSAVGSSDWSAEVQRVSHDAHCLPVACPLAHGRGPHGLLAITPDSTGGALLFWSAAERSRSLRRLFVQRMSADGDRMWRDSGVCLAEGYSPKCGVTVAADGRGGAFVGWGYARPGALRAQHISSAGLVSWGREGSLVTRGRTGLSPSGIVPDGIGGLFLVWRDYRFGTVPALLSQRLDSLGVVQWPAGGIRLSSRYDLVGALSPAVDDAGSLVVAWEAIASATSRELWAQKVAPDGLRGLGWPAEGVRVCSVGDDEQLLWTRPTRDKLVATLLRLSHSGECDLASRTVGLDRAGSVGATTVPISRPRVYRRGRPRGFRVRFRARAHLTFAPAGSTRAMVAALAAPYPNPARDVVRIPVSLSRSAGITVRICSPNGAVVDQIFSGDLGSGIHEFVWNLHSPGSAPVTRGVYFVTARTESSVDSRQVIVY